MNDLVFVIVIFLPILIGCWGGGRVGWRRLGVFLAPWTISLILSSLLVYLGFHNGWYWPWGLISPLVLGLLCHFVLTVTLFLIVRNRLNPPSRSSPKTVSKFWGGTLGTLCGGCFSLFLWLSLSLFLITQEPSTPSEPRSIEEERSLVQQWGKEIVNTAHKGFIKHLPVLGPATEDINSIKILIEADNKHLEIVAEENGLDELSELPTFKALLKDESLMEDVKSVSEGSLKALYRLQKNELILEFVKEEKVKKLLKTVKPKDLADRIKELESNN